MAMRIQKWTAIKTPPGPTKHVQAEILMASGPHEVFFLSRGPTCRPVESLPRTAWRELTWMDLGHLRQGGGASKIRTPHMILALRQPNTCLCDLSLVYPGLPVSINNH